MTEARVIPVDDVWEGVTATPDPPARTNGAAKPSADRLPPHDVDAERAILGGCILDPHQITAVDQIIRDDDWYRPAHALIWHALVDLDTTGQPVEPTALAAHLRATGALDRAGGGNYLLSLTETAVAASSTYYARIITELAHQRRTVELGTWIVQAGHINADADQIRQRLELHLAQRDRVNGTTPTDPRMLAAGAWLFDQPDTIDALWGYSDDVLWARGETLLIAGPSGVGKTTIGQQLTLARLGILKPDLLGLPIQPSPRCLYLAMDRPAQARRSLRRMLTPDDRDQVDQALTIWKGPPPAQVITNPRVLLELATKAGLRPGDFVVIDSVKDVAIGIAKDDVGAAVNTALQELLAADIDVLALHHIRKADHANAGKEPATIDELYGSSHIVNGAGSVISIWGAPGDPIVSFKHMKQPATPLGPWRLIHDADHGRTDIWHEVDLLQLVKGTGSHGLTATAAAHTLYGVVDGKPTSSQTEKARRRLEKYVTDGLLVRQGGTRKSQNDPGDPARYYLAARIDRTTGEVQ